MVGHEPADSNLLAVLATLNPKARDTLRRVLIRVEPTVTRSPSQLLRYHDGRDDDWADIIDALTMYPDARRRVVRFLGEIEAA